MNEKITALNIPGRIFHKKLFSELRVAVLDKTDTKVTSTLARHFTNPHRPAVKLSVTNKPPSL